MQCSRQDGLCALELKPCRGFLSTLCCGNQKLVNFCYHCGYEEDRRHHHLGCPCLLSLSQEHSFLSFVFSHKYLLIHSVFFFLSFCFFIPLSNFHSHKQPLPSSSLTTPIPSSTTSTPHHSHKLNKRCQLNRHPHRNASPGSRYLASSTGSPFPSHIFLPTPCQNQPWPPCKNSKLASSPPSPSRPLPSAPLPPAASISPSRASMTV